MQVIRVDMQGKTEAPRDARNQKARRHDKPRKEWSQHQNKRKSQTGQDQASGGASVPRRPAAPAATPHGNLQNSEIRSKSVLKPSPATHPQTGAMSDQ